MFAAFSSVKDHPGREVFAEFLKFVIQARGDEERITLGEGDAFSAMTEPSIPVHDDVDLISCVGCLVVDISWRIVLDRHRAMLQPQQREVACLREGDMPGLRRVAHESRAFIIGNLRMAGRRDSHFFEISLMVVFGDVERRCRHDLRDDRLFVTA